MHELKIYRGVTCHNNEEWCKVYKGNWLVSKLTQGISRILTQASESLKNLHFNGLFIIKLYNVSKVQSCV